MEHKTEEKYRTTLTTVALINILGSSETIRTSVNELLKKHTSRNNIYSE